MNLVRVCAFVRHMDGGERLDAAWSLLRSPFWGASVLTFTDHGGFQWWQNFLWRRHLGCAPKAKLQE